jgi:hypothetical protein
VVSSKNVLTDIHLKHFSTLEAEKVAFLLRVNFPQDKENILSICLKSGKYFLDYRKDFPSGKLSLKGRVKILFPDSREKFPY